MAGEGDIGSVTEVMKRQQNSLFGKYRAVVESNRDPEHRGRLQLTIPSVFQDQVTGWVPGAFALGGNGDELAIAIPAEKSHVLVEFIEGDRSSPIWTASYFPTESGTARPNAGFDLEQGNLHMLRSRKGVALRIEDDGESRQVFVLHHPSGAEIRIDEKGIVTLTDKSGSALTLDPEGKVARLNGPGGGELVIDQDKTRLSHGTSSLELSSAGATLTGTSLALDGEMVTLGKNATSPILNAQAFASLFDGHVHGSAAGPTSPAAPPLSAALAGLSLLKVKGA